MTTDRKVLRKRLVSWGLGVSLVGGAIPWLLGYGELALGIALGALVGLLNVMLLAGAVQNMLGDPQRHRPAPSSKWTLPGVLLLKWPLVLLALATILWYMPARPEGVAIGVILSLVAAAAAARPRRDH